MKKTYTIFIFIAVISLTGLNYGRAETIKKNIINLGAPINTSGDEFSPSLTEDGSTMVFNSRMPDENDHNIYICSFINGRWTKPRFMEKLNSPDNDETPYISRDGKVIMFSSDRVGSLRPSVTSDGKVRITYDLYISYLVDGKWTSPSPVPGDVNTINNERSPSLSRDKRSLFFSRYRFKKIRRSKIMQATLKNNKFMDITPLPSRINTNNYDIALVPSINKPGFYFSSRRPGGFGGWDIYYVKYKSGVFGKVINLGPGINSRDDELFLSEVRNDIYFCSNKPDSIGRYDIFSSKVPGKLKTEQRKEFVEKKKTTPAKKVETRKETTQYIPHAGPDKYNDDIYVKKKQWKDEYRDNRTRLHIYVRNSETGKPLSVRFKVYLKNTDDPKAPPVRVSTRKSDVDGRLRIFPKRDISWIVIKVDQPGFIPLRKAIEVDPGKVKDIEIKVSPDALKKISYIFRPIYFKFNSAHIRLEYYPYLHEIINYMRGNEDIKLKIIGHADIRGTYAANYMVSIKRARAIKDYFVKLGLDEKRFSLSGMGNKKPVTYLKGDIFDEMNRRVEFEIIK